MKNSKFWVRVDHGKPSGTILERKTPPKDGGRWADITSCLGLCCTYIPPTTQAPGNFELTDGATGHILASWSAVTGADTYKLERATNSAFTAGLTTVQNTSATSKNDTVTAGVPYYYRLSVITDGVAGNFAYADHIAP